MYSGPSAITTSSSFVFFFVFLLFSLASRLFWASSVRRSFFVLLRVDGPGGSCYTVRGAYSIATCFPAAFSVFPTLACFPDRSRLVRFVKPANRVRFDGRSCFSGDRAERSRLCLASDPVDSALAILTGVSTICFLLLCAEATSDIFASTPSSTACSGEARRLPGTGAGVGSSVS
jgi:hypothetical protein